jgi:hypothetical protein
MEKINENNLSTNNVKCIRGIRNFIRSSMNKENHIKINNPISEEDTNIYYAYSKKTGWDNFQKKNTKSNKIKLTKNEYEAVKRLKNLANVSDYQAYEAYIICDRNENLAANYLLENIIGGGNNNNNRESNFVVEEKKDENQKKNENEKK